MVTITREEYNSLRDDMFWRIGMEAAGVDNWTGYDYGIEAYEWAKECDND